MKNKQFRNQDIKMILVEKEFLKDVVKRKSHKIYLIC